MSIVSGIIIIIIYTFNRFSPRVASRESLEETPNSLKSPQYLPESPALAELPESPHSQEKLPINDLV